MRNSIKNIAGFIFSATFLLISCQSKQTDRNTLKVTATAYYVPKVYTPAFGAWGDTLEYANHPIAVSRDLIDSGLTHGTKVLISGLDDTFTVMDKMNKRWRKRIDLYMGNDRQRAINWGKQKVEIIWIEKNNEQ